MTPNYVPDTVPVRRALAHLRAVDPTLAAVVARVGPYRPRLRTDGSHAAFVARAIVYQQLSGRAAATIHGRFEQLCKPGGVSPAAIVALGDDALRGVGLSRQKIGYLRDLANRCERGDVPIDTVHQLDDSAVIETLTRVRGVGVWTAQMFLIFRLGRPDVLPALDLGIQKAMMRAYRWRSMPTTERVLRQGERWAPYRSVASWYLWRSLDAEAEI